MKNKRGPKPFLPECKSITLQMPVLILDGLRRIHPETRVSDSERVRMACEDYVKTHDMLNEEFNK